MAWAVAGALGTVVAPASQAQQAFSPAWFADRGAAQGAAAQTAGCSPPAAATVDRQPGDRRTGHRAAAAAAAGSQAGAA
ncbi:hypothetical protein G6F31_021459 [Rhizopus arrhizus]|nr:hypothetical protein G6F31_021459 [Rhizopus arrhizus]